MRKVVVTGMGAITPIGNTVEAFSRNLFEGKNGVGAITRFDASKHKTQFACEVKNFDALNFMDKTEMRKMDLFSQYAIVAAEEAIKQSMPEGLAGIDLSRAGVIVGVANGGSTTYENEVWQFAKGDGTPRYHPMFAPMMMLNAASGNISIKYGFKGINYTVAAACASSNIALVEAMYKIRYGQADIIMAGGAEASITSTAMGTFNAMKALSTDNENIATANKPFDKSRDGFLMGEGAVMFILEEEKHALKRGANIIAEIIGGAITSDAFHIVAPHVHGEGAAAAMKLAFADASIKATDIDFLSAHATSTPVGDLCEIAAIRNVFGDNPTHLKISAPKASHGHLLGGAGAIGVLSCIKAMQKQIVPPTINTTILDPNIPASFPIVLQKEMPHTIHTTMCNSFGFGGHNAIVICRKYVIE